MSRDKLSDQITIYETEDGKARIKVRFEHENVWLTQKLMAELFDCSTDNISFHLKNIFAEGELERRSTTEESSVVQKEGDREVNRKITYYSLEAIIAVGYRVNSERGTQFRIWAIDKLKGYILKGFAIDSHRFKHGTRFETRYFDSFARRVSHEVAVALAEKEYESFRVEQDKCFESDFDRMVKKYSSENAKNEGKSQE